MTKTNVAWRRQLYQSPSRSRTLNKKHIQRHMKQAAHAYPGTGVLPHVTSFVGKRGVAGAPRGPGIELIVAMYSNEKRKVLF